MTRACAYISVVVSIGLLAGLAHGQTVIFSVTGLAQAAEQFEMRYGVPVSYEDANYAYAGDLIDQTRPDYARSHPNTPRLFSPKSGPLTLRGDPKEHLSLFNAAADAMPMLQSLLDDHVKAGYPGQFKLIPSGDGLDIVPVAVKNANGILLPDQSLLETKITLPVVRRNDIEILDAICAAVRTNSGKNIGVATNQFVSLYWVVTIGADNEPARTVLQRALDGLKFTGDPTDKVPKAAWSLRYAPGLEMYLLNVRQVVAEAPSLTGKTIRQTVFR